MSGPQPPRHCSHAGDPVTCQQCVDFILDYLEDALPPAQRGEFEAHLGHCPNCVTYLENYRKTIALAAAAGQAPPTPAPPPELIAAIMKSLRREGK